MLDCVFTNWLGSINCTLTEEGYSINLGVSGQKGFPETPEPPSICPCYQYVIAAITEMTALIVVRVMTNHLQTVKKVFNVGSW